MKRTRSILLIGILATITQTAPANANTEQLNIAPNPSFEDDLTGIKTNVCVFGGWFPIGVVTEDGKSEIRITDNVSRTGKKSLRVTPNSNTLRGTIYYSQYNGGEEVRTNITRAGVSGARTIAFRLDRDILSCDATVWIKKADRQGITLKATWYTRRNRIPFIKLAENTVDEPVENTDGWFKYSLHAIRCYTARQVQIAIETNDSEPFYIDDAEIYFNRYPHVNVLVDQFGYETQSHAKGVILQSSASLWRPPVSFSLIDLETSQNVATKKWEEIGYCREWDLYHWQGDFSDYSIPGRYVVETKVDDTDYQSPHFEIHEDLLVPETAEPAYRFFYYQRCDTAVSFFHAACHLDDAKMPDGSHRDLSGG
ncbi:MAG: glycoside hydrolase family 9 protein [Sedimentisphaerales bacterium]|nr:glycoside hydrolase family 9 protein [Sedimentisphaerales bacterium]